MENIIYEVPRTQKYNNIFLKEENSKIKITVQRPSFDFNKIKKERIEIEPEKLAEELNSSGHRFACIGVSTILTMNYQGYDYLIFVNHDTKINGKILLSFISGFVEEENVLEPEHAIDIEIAEELLFFTNEDKIIRYKRDNKELIKPFNNTYTDSGFFLDLIPGDKLELSKLIKKEINIDFKPIKHDPFILYESFINSALIVYNNHLIIPDEIKSIIKYAHHTENIPGGKNLRTKLYHEGVYFAKIKDGKLNGEIFRLDSGKMISINPNNFVLFHGFVFSSSHIKNERYINFSEYVKKQ
jgi:hypothetical protein